VSTAARATERPDIVLVSIDSLRHDHLGCYGYPKDTSPTIDALAAEGVRFSNAVSTTSWTLPSHAALFTGLYDSSHGVVDNGLRLGDEHVTLAEVLQDAGYQTAGFYGGPYLHPTFGFGQGFETYQSCMTRLADDLPGRRVRRQARAVLGAAHADVTGPRLLEEVGAWVDSVGGRPFFLFLHMWDVHYDYVPPERYVEMFDPGYPGDLTGAGFARDPRIRRDMPARDLRHLVALYDGEIRFSDDILGEIFGLLEGRGRFAEALVVVTADHGEEFFEHGGKGHQNTLFEEVLRVPLVMRWPGAIPAGRVVELQVRLIDVMPTILSLAEVPLPLLIQGRDLSPLLRGEELAPRAALAELLVDDRRIRALRSNGEKLVSYGEERFQHFDLQQDPGEQEPLAKGSDRFAGAREALELATERALAFRERLGDRRAAEAPLDREMCERLKALGYLSPELECPEDGSAGAEREGE
jgi:arylsulfatase A-like enzyme